MARRFRFAGGGLLSGAVATLVVGGVLLSVTACGINSPALVGQWQATRVAPSLSPGELFDWSSALVSFNLDGRWEGSSQGMGGCDATESGSYTLHSGSFNSDSDSQNVLDENCFGVPFASLLGYATTVRLSRGGERASFLSERGNALLVLVRAS